MVDQELAQEFIAAVKKDRGIDLSERQAVKILDDWTNIFDLLAKIDHESKNQVEDPKLS
ncbi:MAG: hypothetical protein WCX97_04865 [Candidatus Magasanikbacteria bacterium]